MLSFSYCAITCLGNAILTRISFQRLTYLLSLKANLSNIECQLIV